MTETPVQDGDARDGHAQGGDQPTPPPTAGLAGTVVVPVPSWQLCDPVLSQQKNSQW